MKCCVMEGGVVLYNRCVCVCVCVYMRSVCSLWGSLLVVGTVWVGECGAGDGAVWGCVVVGVGVFRGAGP